MALDPKAIVQQNKVLIALYVLAIIPIPLWVMFVLNGVEGGPGSPKEPTYTSALRTLNQKKQRVTGLVNQIKVMEDQAKKGQPITAPVYIKKHIEEYGARNLQLRGQTESMMKLISDRNTALEKWFDDPKIQEQLKNQKEPTVSDFDTALKDHIAELGKQFPDLAPSDKLWVESASPGTLRQLQKKFWIQDRLIKALKKAGAIQLVDRIDMGVTSGGGPNAVTPVKKDLVVPITVKFGVKCSFRDVPKIVREVLSTDIPMRLMKMHTELFPFSILRKEADGFTPEFKVGTEGVKGFYDQTTYSAIFANPDKVIADEEQVLYEPPVALNLELEALGFDMDAIAAAAAPPPAVEQPKEPEPVAPPPKKKPPKEKE